MKLALVLFALSLVGYGHATKCYSCGSANYDICKEVSSQTPTVDMKTKFGCYIEYRKILDAAGKVTNEQRVYSRGHVPSEAEEKLYCNNEDSLVKCCSGDLCNSVGGMHATVSAVLAGFGVYLAYNLL